MRIDVPSDHWHTLESARSCPDQCLSPEVIANIERAMRRERVMANGAGSTVPRPRE
jgi:hypothetical protein